MRPSGRKFDRKLTNHFLTSLKLKRYPHNLYPPYSADKYVTINKPIIVLKVQGYDSLRAAGESVVTELQAMYDIFVDAAEFNDATLELLNEIPNEIFEFNVRFVSHFRLQHF